MTGAWQVARLAPSGPAPRIAALGVVLGAAQCAFTTAAVADDLPARLLAAVRSLPPGTTGLRVCLHIDETQGWRAQAVPGDTAPPAASEPYSADTRGAYLGGGPAGGPAPPFAQALIDAGAAQRFSLAWTGRERPPVMGVPFLLDTGTPMSATPPTPPPTERTVVHEADEYVVTGPDAALFPHNGDLLSPVPPALPDPGGSGRTRQPPTGVWRTSSVCYAIVADRVREYGDVSNVVGNGNGVSRVSALVLFRPARLPAWAADPRVSEFLRPAMKPLEFRLLAFRNDGDGWVAQPSSFVPLPERTHIVGAAE